MNVENCSNKVKKTSKFGDLGLFTTEASDGVSGNNSSVVADDEVLNGMENFELA